MESGKSILTMLTILLTYKILKKEFLEILQIQVDRSKRKNKMITRTICHHKPILNLHNLQKKLVFSY